MKLGLLLLLLPVTALADITLQNGGVKIGPVQYLDCQVDGGLWCTQDAGFGTAVGKLSCASATATTPGCMSTTTQTFSGNKTFTGTLKAAVVDAGVGSFGALDLRDNTVTGLATSSTFALQSNTTDGTTSATVPAMNFKLGADITNTDLAWCFTDSFGNQRLCGTEAGVWNYAAHATGTGAATVAGGNFTSTLGNGGVASGATPGAAGGGHTFTTGTGGASNGTAAGGSGGTFAVTAGAGGASNGTQRGGLGGWAILACGAGGGGSSGGTLGLTAGAGGAASASWAAGTGGTVVMTAGAGGAENTGAAAAGGPINITAGAGGAAVAGTAGTGGALSIISGGAGAQNAGTGASGGVLTIDTGAATGAATAATMSIGATNAGAITIGRSAQTITLPGVTNVTGSLKIGASGSSMSNSVTSSTSNDFGSIAAQTCSAFTLAVTGVTTNGTTTLSCSYPSALENGIICMCFVSAADTVTFRCCNVTVAPIDPANGTFAARHFR